MMELEVQFQVMAMSIFFGMYLKGSWDFFDCLTGKKVILKIPFEIIFFSLNFALYFYFLFILNNAVFNIYLIFGVFIGVFIHHRFYSPKFLKVYHLIFGKLSAIINKRKEQRKVKRFGKNKKRKTRKKNNKQNNILSYPDR